MGTLRFAHPTTTIIIKNIDIEPVGCAELAKRIKNDDAAHDALRSSAHPTTTKLWRNHDDSRGDDLSTR